MEEQAETILVDVFCDTIYLCTDVIIKQDAQKVKQDIEEAWGYDKNKIFFYQYTQEDYEKYLEHIKTGHICLIEPGIKNIKTLTGEFILEITSVQKY
jgi:hypothetical protein